MQDDEAFVAEYNDLIIRLTNSVSDSNLIVRALQGALGTLPGAVTPVVVSTGRLTDAQIKAREATEELIVAQVELGDRSRALAREFDEI